MKMGLDLTGIGSVADILGKVFDKVSHYIPDPTLNAEARQKLADMAQAEDFKRIDAALSAAQQQTDINKVEASNENLFVSGWRPFVGWCCGAAFAYAFIVQPFLVYLLVAFHSTFDLKAIPSVDMAAMSPILIGMLGLGAMRSYDKTKGTGNGT
jgi:hypothetical protein